jgi:cobalt/nickel transport system permease protein
VGGAHACSHEASTLPANGPVQRLAPQCRLAATLLFVFAVVSTPREAFWVFALDATIVLAVARLARLPIRTLLRRLSVELPFLAFALFLPIVGRGERVDVLGVPLSVAGLWGAWNILAKGTLGVAASVVLATTTPMPEIVRGLHRLRVPSAFVDIFSFMVRYADVVTGELRRMRVARESRGHDPRWIWQARAVASTAGTLFVRSYERGERVYLAMASRGYEGTMPDVDRNVEVPLSDWVIAIGPALLAACASALAWSAS